MSRFSHVTTAMFCTIIVFLSACASTGATTQPAPTTAPMFKPAFAAPPRLAITAAELRDAKSAADFASVRDAAVRAADPLVADPPVMPDGWSNWIFYYACADDGTRLTPQSLDKHECPKCKKVYTDERTVTAYRCVLNERCEFASLSLAWAYAYTGDDKYARPIQRYLLKLATMYPTLTTIRDRHDRTGFLAPGGARRYAQPLDEAVGAVRYAKAYDLTRNSTIWSDGQRALVEANFFRPTADLLLSVNRDISNHQTWHNAGLIAIASVLSDAELVRRVLTMKGGVLDQFQRSLGDDGLWYEGTMAYHNYALAPMLEIADATRRMGLDIHNHPRLRLLIQGPISAMYPDGSFPVTNDSDPASIRMFTGAFEWAWKTYRDPMFAQAAAQGDAAKLATMLGPGAKVEWPPALASQVLMPSGLAYLRAGRGDGAACAVLDLGPHGGGHGHFDKLNLMLLANGREWFLDPGRLSYSHKEYRTWVKFTAAHNTVTLGGRTQAPHEGKLLFFTVFPPLGGLHRQPEVAAGAESTGGYLGSRLRRYLYLNANFLADVFEVQCEQPTQIDWMMHASAERIDPPAGSESKAAEPLGDRDGYPHLTDVKQWTTSAGAQTWNYVQGDQKLPTWLVVNAGETLYTCNGIGYNVSQKTPTIVRRVQGDKAIFIAVYDIGGARSKVIDAKLRGVDEFGVRVHVKVEVTGVAGADEYEVTFKPDGVGVRKAS